MIVGSWISHCICLAAKLGIPDLLSNGPLHISVIAEKTKTNEASLYRLMRALASVNIFQELDDQTFDLTMLGYYLRDGVPNSVRGFALMCGADYHMKMWANLEISVRTGKIAFDEIFGIGCFEYLAERPEQSADFDHAMTSASSQIAPAVAAAYDFSSTRRLMDVSGGRGYLLATILQNYPHLNGVLFDQPHVVSGAGEYFRNAGVEGRYEIAAGNFFEQIPAGCDTYMMRCIIHDWNDEKSTVILRNLRKVIPPDGKLLLIEMVVPEGNEPSVTKWVDIEMLVMTGGRERTARQFSNLLSNAGFVLNRIVATGTINSVLEALPA
jgi:hypothetical protein